MLSRVTRRPISRSTRRLSTKHPVLMRSVGLWWWQPHIVILMMCFCLSLQLLRSVDSVSIDSSWWTLSSLLTWPSSDFLIWSDLVWSQWWAVVAFCRNLFILWSMDSFCFELSRCVSLYKGVEVLGNQGIFALLRFNCHFMYAVCCLMCISFTLWRLLWFRGQKVLDSLWSSETSTQWLYRLQIHIFYDLRFFRFFHLLLKRSAWASSSGFDIHKLHFLHHCDRPALVSSCDEVISLWDNCRHLSSNVFTIWQNFVIFNFVFQNICRFWFILVVSCI